jgi:hypothetical protein
VPKSNAETLSPAWAGSQCALNFGNKIRAVNSCGAQFHALGGQSRQQRVARFINMRDIPQEQMYVIAPFDCLSDRNLNLFKVLGDARRS